MLNPTPDEVIKLTIDPVLHTASLEFNPIDFNHPLVTLDVKYGSLQLNFIQTPISITFKCTKFPSIWRVRSQFDTNPLEFEKNLAQVQAFFFRWDPTQEAIFEFTQIQVSQNGTTMSLQKTAFRSLRDIFHLMSSKSAVNCSHFSND